MQILGKLAGKLAGKVAPKLGFFLGLAFAYAAGDSLANLGATFTRASTATYIDSNGVLQTAASGVARDGHYIGGVRTLLLEGQRTNSFLNSGTPATHTSPSLGTGAYTLWLVGTGSIAVAAGTATITGAGTATSSTPVTFTVTVAGTVTFTVTGSPTRAQCENGPFASSYIATAGSAVTRSADSLFFPWAYVPQALSMFLKAFDLGSGQGASGTGTLLQIGSANPRLLINYRSGGLYGSAYLNGAGTSNGFSTAASGALGTLLEALATLASDGSVQLTTAIAGGVENGGGAVSALALAGAWSSAQLGIGSAPTGSVDGYLAVWSIKIALGVQSLATMRGL